MNQIIYLVSIPFIIGLICLMLPHKIRGVSEFFAIVTSLVCLGFAITVTQLRPFNSDLFLIDNLNWFLIPAIAGLGLLIVLFSLKYFFVPDASKQKVNLYYGYILLTLSAAFGTVVANNLILLLIFWGFLGLTLYLLIQIKSPTFKVQSQVSEVRSPKSDDESTAAKKTFIIIGGADCLMILGIALIWFLTNTFQIDKLGTLLNQSTTLSIIAFWCLVVAALAKSGAMPFHTWIPDMASVSPIPVTAFLPASLDKMLGIYLLARVCLTIFPNLLNQSPSLNLILMFIGTVTIIAAVFMAMIQHDMKKLLSYHAVSQVGYMVLGIGTGTAVGIAGGIFHMLNNAIYKCCLFV
jgi:NADH:ubiquinone oxidoreductase subunit 5 (subunit L)/multisubunit Na+/H+ antiporter MnhA subunit